MPDFEGLKTYYIRAYNGVYGYKNSATFTIDFTDPCLLTTFVDDHELNDMTTSVGIIKTQTAIYTDTVTIEHTSDGYNCGAYDYILAHSDGSTNISGFISIDSAGLITF